MNEPMQHSSGEDDVDCDELLQIKYVLVQFGILKILTTLIESWWKNEPQ